MDTDARFTPRDRTEPGTDPGEERSRSAFPGSWVRLGSWSRRRRWAAVLVGCVLLTLGACAFVARPFLIPSRSMEPTLAVGDRVLVNRLAYAFGEEPKRGDVVVFDGTGSFVRESAADAGFGALLRRVAAAAGLVEPPDTDFVKRVIGVGGDSVVCCDAVGRLQVNGTSIGEPYLRAGDAPSRVPFRTLVPEGRLWVMGDHRAQSRDSRDHLGDPGGGTVPVEKVIGRAAWVVWPAGRWGGLPERRPEPVPGSVPLPEPSRAGEWTPRAEPTPGAGAGAGGAGGQG
ncbi:signal peptidase I [Streptomyces sp. BI20]|uniref:signal peptidase I n=1 Tax=Streptomyces sp. BI20 TaxID=3403460 RepID=UPI003C73F7C9